jgi:excinuclease ABC subunit C
LQQTRTILWEYVSSEFAALLRELELIRRWRPRLNVQGQPHRRQEVYVCLGRIPAPYLFLAGRPLAGMTACFGPIFRSWKAREAVRCLNDWFQLRACPKPQEMIFADQRELFPFVRAAGCIRYEIGTCLGPCAAACSRRSYHKRVQAARSFLAGESRETLDSLAKEMVDAASAMAFEKAAELRDKQETIHWMKERLDNLRSARQRNNFVYPVHGFRGETVWYLIREGQVISSQTVSNDLKIRQALVNSLETVYQKENLNLGLGASEEVDTLMLISSWFRRFPQELARTLDPGQALALCRHRALAG